MRQTRPSQEPAGGAWWAGRLGCVSLNAAPGSVVFNGLYPSWSNVLPAQGPVSGGFRGTFLSLHRLLGVCHINQILSLIDSRLCKQDVSRLLAC